MFVVRTAAAILVLALAASPLAAQQVHFSTPLVGVHDSFFEHYGVHWGFRYGGPGGHMFFSFGGPHSALPPFGGFDPSGSARLGFGSRGSGGGFFFNLSAAQGSRRTISSDVASLTVANGAVGSIRSTTIRPFVTGLVPVVGEGPPAPVLTSPLRERLERLRYEQPAAPAPAEAQPDLLLEGPSEPRPDAVQLRRTSSAERGDISVAEIKRRQALADAADAEKQAELIRQAAAAERAGHWGAARIRYRQAAAQASGELQQQLLEKLEALQDK